MTKRGIILKTIEHKTKTPACPLKLITFGDVMVSSSGIPVNPLEVVDVPGRLGTTFIGGVPGEIQADRDSVVLWIDDSLGDGVGAADVIPRSQFVGAAPLATPSGIVAVEGAYHLLDLDASKETVAELAETDTTEQLGQGEAVSYSHLGARALNEVVPVATEYL